MGYLGLKKPLEHTNNIGGKPPEQTVKAASV